MATRSRKSGREKAPKENPFVPPEGDGLASQHALVERALEEAVARLGDRWYDNVELKSTDVGREILESRGEAAIQIILAAVAQSEHWASEAQRLEGGDEDNSGWHDVPASRRSGNRRMHSVAIVSALMRRALPWQENGLLSILSWCGRLPDLISYYAPLGSIVKSIERFAGEHPVSDALGAAVREFAAGLRASHDKSLVRHGTTLEQLFIASGDTAEPEEPSDQADVRPLRAEAAGNPAVLTELKRYLGLISAESDTDAEQLAAPIGLAPLPDSPLLAEHALIEELFDQALEVEPLFNVRIEQLAIGKRIKRMDAFARGRLILAACERAVAVQLRERPRVEGVNAWETDYLSHMVVALLCGFEFTFDRDGLFDFLLFYTEFTQRYGYPSGFRETVVEEVICRREFADLSEGERYVLHRLRASLIPGPLLDTRDERVSRLTKMIADGARFYLVPGEVWSDAVNATVSGMPPEQRRRWMALLTHLLTARSARPSSKWQKTANSLIEAIGAKSVRGLFLEWISLIPRGRTRLQRPKLHADPRSFGETIHELNADCLRGMLWLLPTMEPDPDAARTVAAAALSAYKKIPGVGPRATKVGNAAIYALSEMMIPEAVGHLATLKTRVKFGTAQKEIEKAFDLAARRAGLPREEIEEMAVPAFGLDEPGRRTEQFGDYTAEVIVAGTDSVQLNWARADGKSVKSAPAAVKKEFGADLKELSQACKDIQAMLSTQRARIDSLFLDQRSWPMAQWRERYLDHPLVGTIARRLIWRITTDDRTVDAVFHDGALVDVDQRTIEGLKDDSRVELWHPIGRPVDEVLAWRRLLESLQIRQPFKQAHREVYVLTDAERNTRVYSNRFAAHVLRQHQFNALCAARSWKNKLRLLVDADYPPASRTLTNWKLRAEYWIEGLGEDYDIDTNESGVFHRIATDQVRFYRHDTAMMSAHAGGGGYTPGYRGVAPEPIPLDEIPALVFSEIMRDVDLFVGVASVGNDPTWQDGGPDGRHLDYWQRYSFGSLGESAITRRDVLMGLIPRLAIADRCSFSEKFLVVRGDLRTYKIHLGSGNILMEPNDEYLCIVQGRSAVKPAADSNLFLPFEGDERMAVILSKALMLANDKKITDPTITRQIGR